MKAKNKTRDLNRKNCDENGDRRSVSIEMYGGFVKII